MQRGCFALEIQPDSIASHGSVHRKIGVMMKPKKLWNAPGSLCLLLSCGLAAAPTLAKQQTIKPKQIQKPGISRAEDPLELEIQRKKLSTQLEKLDAASSTLKKLVRQPMPKSLGKQNQKEWQRHTEWMEKLIKRLSKHRRQHQAMLAGSKPSEQKALTLTEQRDMAADMRSRSMEFLALQNAMQMESRQYGAVSNALKARHDSAMAAIRNMK
jgi:hypothetical protein